MTSKIVNYRVPGTVGPQLGPQISIRKRDQQYFLFKNVFEHTLEAIVRFKSSKFTIFRDFEAHGGTSEHPGAPKYIKMLPSKNSHIFEYLTNIACSHNMRNIDIQIQNVKTN